jgi:hypothetical protein
MISALQRVCASTTERLQTLLILRNLRAQRRSSVARQFVACLVGYAAAPQAHCPGCGRRSGSGIETGRRWFDCAQVLRAFLERQAEGYVGNPSRTLQVGKRRKAVGLVACPKSAPVSGRQTALDIFGRRRTDRQDIGTSIGPLEARRRTPPTCGYSACAAVTSSRCAWFNSTRAEASATRALVSSTGEILPAVTRREAAWLARCARLEQVRSLVEHAPERPARRRRHRLLSPIGHQGVWLPGRRLPRRGHARQT